MCLFLKPFGSSSVPSVDVTINTKRFCYFLEMKKIYLKKLIHILHIGIKE